MLWSEFKFRCGRVAKNRIVMAPLTNTQSLTSELSDEEYNWLARRVSGGFSLVTTCATHVVKTAQAWPGQLGIFSDAHKAGFAKLADAGRRSNCFVLPQLFHGGFRSPRSLTGVQPVSASSFNLQTQDFERPASMTGDEILQLITEFAAAAKRSVDAGLPGVELHGANGYLFTQFLSPCTNQRTDRWGGSLENRAGFLFDTVSAIRDAIGPDKILGVRISPENTKLIHSIDINEMIQVAQQLHILGVDYISLSLWDALKMPDQYPDGQQTVVERFRRAVPAATPLIASGKIWSLGQAGRVLDTGADFVALGAAAIANPEWPRNARQPGFEPTRFPLTRSELKDRAVSERCATYLERWGFVADAGKRSE